MSGSARTLSTSDLSQQLTCSICHESIDSLYSSARESDALIEAWVRRNRGLDVPEPNSTSTLFPTPRRAISLCKSEPTRHLICLNPCALDFLAQPHLGTCPLCRGALTPTARLCQEAFRLHLLLGEAESRARASRENVLAQIDAAFEMLKHTSDDNTWQTKAVPVSRDDGNTVRELEMLGFGMRRQTLHVDVSIEEPLDDTRVAAVRWRKVEQGRPVECALSLPGPWPRTLHDDDVQRLMRELLGIDVQRRQDQSELDLDARCEALKDSVRFTLRWPPEREVMRNVTDNSYA